MNSTAGTTDRLTATMKATTAVGAACALGVLLAACGSQTAADRATATTHTAAAHPTTLTAPATPTAATQPAGTPTSASPTTAAAAPDPVMAAPVTAAASTPAPKAPVAPVTRPTASPAAAAGVPHFATPEASMRYLVAAYNTGNETNIRHVTTPTSRDQFESERQWVKKFTFHSCTANGAPAWDYICVLDITTTMPGVQVTTDPATGTPIMNEVTVLVAPAARTGFYLEANEGCGG
jgi:hypothetical protein